VPSPKDSGFLGYIRFSGIADRGFVEITNQGATLQPCHLDIGGSTKANCAKQAGVFGEGLKLALLVLQREPQNHSIYCLSGSFSWTYNFNKRGNLTALSTRLPSTKLQQIQNDNDYSLLDELIPFAPSPTEDVQFFIGKAPFKQYEKRDQAGNRKMGDSVHLSDFEDWCKSALFLQDLRRGIADTGILTTCRGDLITDPRLWGKLYLKGLLLGGSARCKSASISGKPLKFGYNFKDVTTNRERQPVLSPLGECETILHIWDEALKSKPSYVEHLHKMLMSDEVEYADVWFAPKVMRLQTAICLQKHLMGDANKWYYSVEEKHEVGRIIIAFRSTRLLTHDRITDSPKLSMDSVERAYSYQNYTGMFSESRT
jgi:hypothetical protein